MEPDGTIVLDLVAQDGGVAGARCAPPIRPAIPDYAMILRHLAAASGGPGEVQAGCAPFPCMAVSARPIRGNPA